MVALSFDKLPRGDVDRPLPCATFAFPLPGLDAPSGLGFGGKKEIKIRIRIKIKIKLKFLEISCCWCIPGGQEKLWGILGAAHPSPWEVWWPGEDFDGQGKVLVTPAWHSPVPTEPG